MTVKQYLHKYRTPLIALTLVLTPLLGLFFLMIIGKLYEGTDIAFHYQRFIELRYDIAHHVIPQFFNHEAAPMGSAINIYYPYESLLPFILATWFIHRPMTLVMGVYFGIWYSTSLSSYYSAKKYFHSYKTGLLFSVLYTAASTIGNALILNDDIGQALGFAWQPLILFGFLCVLKDGKRWKMLVVGMSLLIMSHLLTTILIAVLLAVIAVCNIKRIFTHRDVILGYIKAVIMTVLLTMIFWMPFLYTSIHNNFYNPGNSKQFWMSGLIISNSGTYIHENGNLIDVIGVAIGIVGLYLLFRHLYGRLRIPAVDWEIWAVGIFYWFCNINVSPLRHFFGSSFLRVFQFSFRTALPIHICFVYLSVKWLAGYYSMDTVKQSNYKRVWIAVLAFMALFMQVGNQLNDKLIYQQRATYHSSHECVYGIQMDKVMKSHQGRGFVISNISFKHIRNSAILQDYQPENTTNAVKNNPYANVGQGFELMEANHPSQTHHVTVTPSGIRTDVSQTYYHAMLPIVWYHGFRYSATDNRKPIKWTRDNRSNYIEIPKLTSGYHLIQLHPQVPKSTNLAVDISALSWLGMLVLSCCGFARRLNRKR